MTAMVALPGRVILEKFYIFAAFRALNLENGILFPI
jgi:hypothetical protein